MSNNLFCSTCGKGVHANAVVCTSCGCPIGATPQGVQEWGSGMMAFLCLCSFFIPIVGWIVGGVNLKHKARNGQSITLIVIGGIAFLLALAAMAGG